ncbi:ShlB/FhaC/HecB family hemolysin secretion/activation protein [Bartonella harrusi]|uniref:ShlB/FhaC/HecB family hemolysin secretion/activation protein n=1 Tax=Bartonella harrusi TaxID=2961895 RepID=A0ABY5EWX7_9HYPH|nr:ShlB/FhaC/HecB family hemolysin secretion/activation protein [Bartonella harrusi]UTO29360.1 ShlB/FhaC/HecB family hemolysin secretion/activation protein [Bartonella harrusi]UTO29376.1 ShlB/FhaC/HecB family hemolysin secretion/activation protein [Bartonella harrusi]
MIRLFCCFVLAMVLSVIALPGFAENIRDQVIHQSETIQRQQTQQRRFQEWHKRTRKPEVFFEDDEESTSDNASRSKTCFMIKNIALMGARLISYRDLHGSISRWEGHCLGIDDINKVLKAVTMLYVKRGYIAVRAYLPEQDLRGGHLKIVVVEGRVEDITLDGHKVERKDRGEIATAFPNLIGHPTNLRAIEQGLDQINRLFSRQATLNLEAGKVSGDSILDLHIVKQKPWSFTVSSDNLGAQATGLYQTRLSLSFDDLLASNDQWSFSYQRSMDGGVYYFTDARPNSDTVTGSFSIPYGYWTAGFDGTWSQYHSSVKGIFSDILTSGKSLSLTPWISRVIARDQEGKTWLTGRLTWKYADNFILGSRIDVSSRKLAIATFAFDHMRQWLGGELNVHLGFHKGLAILDAYDDKEQENVSLNAPKGQFRKWSFSLSYVRPFSLHSYHFRYNSLFSGQWSPDSLFGSEQISLGGNSSIRGVREAVYYGNNGVFWRNELSLLLPGFTSKRGRKLMSQFSPYLALDLGAVADDASKNSFGGRLVGATLGFHAAGEMMDVDLSYSNLLKASTPLEKGTRGGVLQVRALLRF